MIGERYLRRAGGGIHSASTARNGRRDPSASEREATSLDSPLLQCAASALREPSIEWRVVRWSSVRKSLLRAGES